MSKRYAIGIDIGSTNLRVGLVSRDGEIIRKAKEPTFKEILDSVFKTSDGFFLRRLEELVLV